MTKIVILFSVCFLLVSCSGDDDLRHNPYLPELRLSLQLDLTLPQYNRLNFPGNHFVTYNYGLNGIVVYNLNNSQYMAFELSDPNHVLMECSTLTVSGTEASCNCQDGNTYTIVTGQRLTGEGEYPLKPYRAVRTGNILEVSN